MCFLNVFSKEWIKSYKNMGRLLANTLGHMSDVLMFYLIPEMWCLTEKCFKFLQKWPVIVFFHTFFSNTRFINFSENPFISLCHCICSKNYKLTVSFAYLLTFTMAVWKGHLRSGWQVTNICVFITWYVSWPCYQVSVRILGLLCTERTHIINDALEHRW